MPMSVRLIATWPIRTGREVQVANDSAEVAALVVGLAQGKAAAIGRRPRERVLAEHTYDHRAAEVERLLLDACAAALRWEAAS